MKLGKRLTAICAAMMMAVTGMAMTSSANYDWIPVRTRYLSGNDISYIYTLSGNQYYDYNNSDNFWCKPIAYIKSSVTYDDLYYIQGLFSDGTFLNSVSTQLQMQVYGYKHEAVIASGGSTNSSGYHTGIPVFMDDSGTVELKNDSASFIGYVEKI